MIGNLPYIHIIDAELVAPCQKEFLTSRHGIIFLYCPYTYIMVTIYDYLAPPLNAKKTPDTFYIFDRLYTMPF